MRLWDGICGDLCDWVPAVWGFIQQYEVLGLMMDFWMFR